MREAQARAEIVRWSRLLWERRLVSGSSGNLSARLADGTVVITPTGRSLGFIDEADLVHVDAAGLALGSGRPSGERPLHLAAYAARPDISVVVHTHPTYCVAWANEGRLFPRETVAAMESLAPIAWVEYHPTGTRELAEATRDALAGATPMALLARHGLVAVGADFETPFVQTDLAEECAKVAYLGALLAQTERIDRERAHSGA